MDVVLVEACSSGVEPVDAVLLCLGVAAILTGALLGWGPSSSERDVLRAPRRPLRPEPPFVSGRPRLFEAYAPTPGGVGRALLTGHLAVMTLATAELAVRQGVAPAFLGLCILVPAFLIAWMRNVEWMTWVIGPGIALLVLNPVYELLGAAPRSWGERSRELWAFAEWTLFT